ncbi:hypothetical protein Unana1_08283 [Umbelopsis nana]
MSWHKGWGKRKKWGYCNPGTTWYVSEQDAYYNNVDQPVQDSNGRAFAVAKTIRAVQARMATNAALQTLEVPLAGSKD